MLKIQKMVSNNVLRYSVKDDYHEDVGRGAVHEDVLDAGLRVTINKVNLSCRAIVACKVRLRNGIEIRPKIKRRHLFLRKFLHRRFKQ